MISAKNAIPKQLLATLCALWLGLAPGTARAELDISAYIRNYTGVFLDNGDFSIVQNTFEPTFAYMGDRAAVHITPYLYHYATQDHRLDFDVRQAYLDVYFEHADVRVGQQQIIWGKADGVFITDIVSPKDLSEFLLRDFEEIRRGITAAKTNFYIANHTIELVWVPVFRSTKLPPVGSPWRPAMEIPTLPASPTIDSRNQEVPLSIKNSEIFGKYSVMTSLMDLEVMGGYMWDDDPSMHIHKTRNPDTGTVSTITILPQHHRLAVAGTSFSTTIWEFILRGEAAYYFGKQYNTRSSSALDGLVEKDYIHYVVGVDKTLWGVRLSTQFIQKIIVNHDNSMLAEKTDNTMTFLAATDFLQETLKIDLFAYLGINNKDALIRPRLSYTFIDGLSATLGADLFLGTKGTFGQFDTNDMVYTKIKFNF